MDARLRRVSKLRLRSCSEALNRRGAILIEDALHTASLPDSDGSRLVVIRKVSLGRIRAGDAPSSIALRIETVCRQSAGMSVHATALEAGYAPAVYFDDDLEPYVLLALRLVHHQQTSEWFWPLAVKGWTPSMDRDETMRVLLAGALSSSACTVAALVAACLIFARTQWLGSDRTPATAATPAGAALRTGSSPGSARRCAWARPSARARSRRRPFRRCPRCEPCGRRLRRR